METRANEFDERVGKLQMEKAVELSVGRSVLELGCGNGQFIPMLYERFDRVVGLDASKENIASVRKTTSDSRHSFFVAKAEDFQIDEKFDTILVTMLLEHVDNPVAVLKNANRLPHTYKEYVKSKNFYNWQGSIVKNKGPDMETICSHPYKSLVVCWDGKCVPCCVDYDNNYIIGDANSASLEEIWNSDKMQQIRRKPMEICRFCNIQRIPEEEKTGDAYFVKHAMR